VGPVTTWLRSRKHKHGRRNLKRREKQKNYVTKAGKTYRNKRKLKGKISQKKRKRSNKNGQGHDTQATEV
ncbi:hypothetical protein HHI36_006428, partial [Cryptolaemus montrouzieri]